MCKIIPWSEIGSWQGTGLWKIKYQEVREKDMLAIGGGEYIPGIPFATHSSEYRFEVISQSS